MIRRATMVALFFISGMNPEWTISSGGVNYMAESDLAREMRAQLAAVTGGLAPDDYAQAWWDWYLNIAQAPQKQTDIAHTAFKAMMDNFSFAMQASTGKALAPVSDDARFSSDAWKQWPFNMMARGYLNWAKVMQQATTDVPGLAPRSADLIGFSTRQMLDATSPANH